MYGEQTDADVVNRDGVTASATLDDDDADDVDTTLAGPGQVGTRNEMRVSGWFANLIFRAKHFGHAYPFQLSADGQELEVVPIDTNLRRLYVQMLLSASLRLVPKNRREELTESFEETSHEIFKQLMPAGWEVHRFGAKSASRYKGLLYDKHVALCKDLRKMH